jgi:hypothetical protein
MPWKIDGTFQRVTNNTAEDSPDRLWQQDLEASIKVIASRHDFHDHDMATGITRTLNIDGLNQMYANLNMGGYTITNLAPAAGLSDVPVYGQIAGALDWEFDTGNQLRLLDRNGDVIDTVIIPTSGGGGGVTSIGVGGGLVSSTTNPITLSGTIGMAVLGTGQNYEGGISSIQIDDYGRVTQVVTGAFANTNLSIPPEEHNDTTLDIASSTGDNVTVPAATTTKAGLMTAAQVLALQGAQGMIPPTELLGVNPTLQTSLFLPNPAEHLGNENNSASGTNVWEDVFNVLGSGVIDYLGVSAGDDPEDDCDLRVLIDGVAVWTGLDAIQDADLENDGFSIIGDIEPTTDVITFSAVKFNTSLQVQIRRAAPVGFMFINTYFRYQLQ